MNILKLWSGICREPNNNEKENGIDRQRRLLHEINDAFEQFYRSSGNLRSLLFERLFGARTKEDFENKLKEEEPLLKVLKDTRDMYKTMFEDFHLLKDILDKEDIMNSKYFCRDK